MSEQRWKITVRSGVAGEMMDFVLQDEAESEVERLTQELKREGENVRNWEAKFGHTWERAESAERALREAHEIIEDLIDRQHDYPTDLSRDHKWSEAFKRAAAALPTEQQPREEGD